MPISTEGLHVAEFSGFLKAIGILIIKNDAPKRICVQSIAVALSANNWTLRTEDTV